MPLNKLALALTLVLSTLPLSAMAQEASTEATEPATTTEQPSETAAPAAAAEEETPALTWNLSLTSDYVFRGITQTDFKPAIQGGLDYGLGDSGVYIGAWASNVDFVDSDGPDIELDTYIGWSKDVADGFNLDLHAVRYTYLGERAAYGSIDYNEFFAKGTWKETVSFTVAYANDYANSGYSSLYYNLAGSWAVGNDFSVNASVGHTDFSDSNGSYNDWNLGVSRQFGPVNAALNYYDATGNVIDALYGSHRASDSVVLTLAFGNG